MPVTEPKILLHHGRIPDHGSGTYRHFGLASAKCPKVVASAKGVHGWLRYTAVHLHPFDMVTGQPIDLISAADAAAIACPRGIVSITTSELVAHLAVPG